ncbi:MAG: hypothetical protein WEB00_08625 [Dehalococcoidia bacterium]
MYLRIGAGVALLVVLAVFALANSQEVKVDFVVHEYTVRLAWALLLAAAISFGAGFLFARNLRRR